MRIVIVGSVAAGTSVGAKARRNTESAQIVIYERDVDISYSGCGLPYYVGGEVPDMAELTPRDPAWFATRYNIDIRTGHEVTAVDPAARTVSVTDLATGEAFTDSYDVLVLATGVTPVVPDVLGVEAAGVFTVRNPSDARAICAHLEAAGTTSAVIVGAGFIGMEMAEQLVGRGVAATIVERLPQVMPPLDADMAHRVAESLRGNGVDLRLGASVTAIEGDPVTAVVLDTGERIDAGLVILAVGVRPNTELAVQAGVTLGASGAIAVDERMATDVPGIWAVGDVAESFSVITGAPVWHPLGSTANKMGRIAGDAITGGELTHRGILGTGIFRVFDLTVAQAGLTERAATEQGFDVVVLHNIKPDRPTYLGGRDMVIKAIADRASGRVLGAQIVGPQGVDKRIDVLATAITFGAKAGDLFHLDLAYAPPFATTKDPVLYTGMALDNALRGSAPLITPAQLDARRAAGETIQVVDVRSAKDHAKSHVDGAIHIPLGALRERAGELDPNMPTVTYCNGGISGNAGQNILRCMGFAWVANLSGGNKNYQSYLKSQTGRP
ncbi:MAG: FAD-dependent oxidoreductase [Candidatus Nanopelagicales bacterium]|jgi:NADPH-dependent 2,4-dienoyl-CoA reductase/sulfur reductase-like enzyme/rhodanese-related sulfurtransferase|nr:FAD-dependent oxidoreductase [Candidatus Nanopelagicales bacterium]